MNQVLKRIGNFILHEPLLCFTYIVDLSVSLVFFTSLVPNGGFALYGFLIFAILMTTIEVIAARKNGALWFTAWLLAAILSTFGGISFFLSHVAPDDAMKTAIESPSTSLLHTAYDEARTKLNEETQKQETARLTNRLTLSRDQEESLKRLTTNKETALNAYNVALQADEASRPKITPLEVFNRIPTLLSKPPLGTVIAFFFGLGMIGLIKFALRAFARMGKLEKLRGMEKLKEKSTNALIRFDETAHDNQSITPPKIINVLSEDNRIKSVAELMAEYNISSDEARRERNAIPLTQTELRGKVLYKKT